MSKQLIAAIMRAQPYHYGHQALIKRALEITSGQVLIMMGSSGNPRTVDNPFAAAERQAIIMADSELDVSRLIFEPIYDFKYSNPKWIAQVQNVVTKRGHTDISIIGRNKDESTVYLNWFPQWGQIDMDHFGDGRLDATAIRELLYRDFVPEFLRSVLPESSFNFISKFRSTAEFKDLQNEFEYIERYKKSWAAAPYSPTFVTVDAVVEQDGHILLVKRRAYPGKGLLALPGGFLNQNERILDGVIRELREETRLKVPEPVLRGSLNIEQPSLVFDHPKRSTRGRTITHAYHFKLTSTGSLPQVKGGDDAAKAMWVPFNKITRDVMFEDHGDIISHFLSVDFF